MLEVMVYKTAPEEWNSLVSSVPEGTVFQTTQWADFMKDFLKAKPSYILAKEGNKIKGMLLTIKVAKGYGRVFNKPFSRVMLNILKKIHAENNWSFGPLVLDKDGKGRDIATSILEKTTGKNVSPPIHGNVNQGEFKRSFKTAGFKAKQMGTFFIDLTQNTDVLWKNVIKGTRKNVGRCKRKDIIIEQVSDKEGIKEYYDLALESRKSLGLSKPTMGNITYLWKHLHKNGNMEIFIAKEKERPLAALTILQFNGTLHELGAVRSVYDRQEKIYANDLLKWHIIEWGHNNGYRLYDLTGVSPNPKNAKERGIYNFKAKWGGKLVNYYAYSKS